MLGSHDFWENDVLIRETCDRTRADSILHSAIVADRRGSADHASDNGRRRDGQSGWQNKPIVQTRMTGRRDGHARLSGSAM